MAKKPSTKRAAARPPAERRRINVSISREVYNELAAFAGQQTYEIPLSKIVERAIRQHIGGTEGR